MLQEVRRPVDVAGASGGFPDCVRTISSLAKNDGVAIIVGDWLFEMIMTIHGTGKIRNKSPTLTPQNKLILAEND